MNTIPHILHVKCNLELNKVRNKHVQVDADFFGAWRYGNVEMFCDIVGWCNGYLHLSRISSEPSGQSGSPSQSQLSDTQVSWSPHRNSPTSQKMGSNERGGGDRDGVWNEVQYSH